VVLFGLLCVKYSVFEAAPPLPPSPEQAFKVQDASRKEGFFSGVKRLLENRGFILLLITYGLAVAVINSLSTLLNQLILTYFPVRVHNVSTPAVDSCLYTDLKLEIIKR
jgi:FLVCR family feline leukemia virus subgroup C receptor-related protein